MKTNDIVINKMIKWLEDEDKSYQWLAEQLGVSKAVVVFMLKGERTLKSEHIEQFAKIMRITLSNRRSKRELDSLLFVINDYLGLKEQVK